MSLATDTLTLNIVIGSITLIVGIILGVVIGRLSSRSRKSGAAEAKKGAAQARPRLQEILRLFRDPDTGRVITEFQNRPIRDPRTLNQRERDYLVRLAKDWSTWLGIPEPQPVAKAEPEAVIPASQVVEPASAMPAVQAIEPTPVEPAIQPADLAPVEPAPVEPAVQAIEPAPLAPTSQAVEPAPVTPPPAAAPVNVPVIPADQVSPATTPPAEPITHRSIVQQVDDILQEKLATHPMPIPVIHLVEDPYEGVIVWVNGQKFVGIESVTDPEARAIIRTAAVEWEHRTEK